MSCPRQNRRATGCSTITHRPSRPGPGPGTAGSICRSSQRTSSWRDLKAKPDQRTRHEKCQIQRSAGQRQVQLDKKHFWYSWLFHSHHDDLQQAPHRLQKKGYLDKYRTFQSSLIVLCTKINVQLTAPLTSNHQTLKRQTAIIGW